MVYHHCFINKDKKIKMITNSLAYHIHKLKYKQHFCSYYVVVEVLSMLCSVLLYSNPFCISLYFIMFSSFSHNISFIIISNYIFTTKRRLMGRKTVLSMWDHSDSQYIMWTLNLFIYLWLFTEIYTYLLTYLSCNKNFMKSAYYLGLNFNAKNTFANM